MVGIGHAFWKPRHSRGDRVILSCELLLWTFGECDKRDIMNISCKIWQRQWWFVYTFQHFWRKTPTHRYEPHLSLPNHWTACWLESSWFCHRVDLGCILISTSWKRHHVRSQVSSWCDLVIRVWLHRSQEQNEQNLNWYTSVSGPKSCPSSGGFSLSMTKRTVWMPPNKAQRTNRRPTVHDAVRQQGWQRAQDLWFLCFPPGHPRSIY